MSTTPHLLTLIILASTLFQPLGMVDEAAGQILGDCSITTTPSTVVIDVSPGSPGIGISQVDVENPTPHTEIIRIDAETGGLAYAIPGSITLGPYASTSFQLSLKAIQRQSVGSINAKISCTVETVDGIPTQTRSQRIRRSSSPFASSHSCGFRPRRPSTNWTPRQTIH